MVPIIVIGAYGLIAAVPRVAVARTAKILENSADYSIQNTVRQALFLPLSHAQKYRAKTALDTFFYRCGDLGQAGIVWLGTRLVFTVRGFAICDALLAVVWLGVASALARSADPGTFMHADPRWILDVEFQSGTTRRSLRPMSFTAVASELLEKRPDIATAETHPRTFSAVLDGAHSHS